MGVEFFEGIKRPLLYIGMYSFLMIGTFEKVSAQLTNEVNTNIYTNTNIGPPSGVNAQADLLRRNETVKDIIQKNALTLTLADETELKNIIYDYAAILFLKQQNKNSSVTSSSQDTIKENLQKYFEIKIDKKEQQVLFIPLVYGKPSGAPEIFSFAGLSKNGLFEFYNSLGVWAALVQFKENLKKSPVPELAPKFIPDFRADIYNEIFEKTAFQLDSAGELCRKIINPSDPLNYIYKPLSEMGEAEKNEYLGKFVGHLRQAINDIIPDVNFVAKITNNPLALGHQTSFKNEAGETIKIKLVVVFDEQNIGKVSVVYFETSDESIYPVTLKAGTDFSSIVADLYEIYSKNTAGKINTDAMKKALERLRLPANDSSIKTFYHGPAGATPDNTFLYGQ